MALSRPQEGAESRAADAAGAGAAGAGPGRLMPGNPRKRGHHSQERGYRASPPAPAVAGAERATGRLPEGVGSAAIAGRPQRVRRGGRPERIPERGCLTAVIGALAYKI